ncbi:MAG: RDD family protein [Nocardioides sp.]
MTSATSGSRAPADVPRTASWPRRTLALALDWVASTLVTVLILGPADWLGGRGSGFVTMAVFAVESSVLLALTGGTFGKLLTGIRVTDVTTGRPPSLLRALLRQILVCLAFPPLIFKSDGRGLHDLAAHTHSSVLGR